MKILTLIYIAFASIIGGSVLSCLTPTEYEFQQAVAAAEKEGYERGLEESKAAVNKAMIEGKRIGVTTERWWFENKMVDAGLAQWIDVEDGLRVCQFREDIRDHFARKTYGWNGRELAYTELP